jgi:hypothetical protein
MLLAAIKSSVLAPLEQAEYDPMGKSARTASHGSCIGFQPPFSGVSHKIREVKLFWRNYEIL